MLLSIPTDIRAEIINNYLSETNKNFMFLGNHKRNTYGDILSVTYEDERLFRIELSKAGLYDILPEALFHPIDRFDSISADEYKDRFDKEVERQRFEELEARKFFTIFDKLIFEISSLVENIKQIYYDDNSLISDIICDSLQEEYRHNRFVKRLMEFLPNCSCLRGNNTLITLILRKILADEGIRLLRIKQTECFTDEDPRYNYTTGDVFSSMPSSEWYLGNTFDEETIRYELHYWSDDICHESFLQVVEEIKVFEKFLNDWFIGVDASLNFEISSHTLPLRLSDDICYNYLNYNTNL